MAGAASKDDFALFLSHLQKTMQNGPPKPCPVCGSGNLGMLGPLGLVAFRPKAQGGGPSDHAFPVAVLMCADCFHMQLFSWDAIAKAESDGESAIRIVPVPPGDN